jgi:hypothetical protein
MKPNLLVLLLASGLLVSCAYNRPYHPASRPEKIEYRKAMLDVYPEDVRQHLDQYTNSIVAFAGIIRSSDAYVTDDPAIIRVESTFEHHYFDWQEDRLFCRQHLLPSPRGEGLFRTDFLLRKKRPDVSLADAEKYAAPGKLAIVFGTPEIVQDCVVVLKYRYIRIINKNFRTDQFDYGRFGEPFQWIGK